MADALDDDYVASDTEYDGTAAEAAAASTSDAEGSNSGDEGQHGTRSGPGKGGKRTRTKSNSNGVKEDTDLAARSQKKRKLKERDRARKAKKAAANLALEPGAASRMPPDMQADHLRKLMRMCKPFARMTDLELDEVGFLESMLVDTSSTGLEKRTLDGLIPFVRKALPDAVEAASTPVQAAAIYKGRPTILVITGNAQRAAELARAVRPLNPASSKKPPNSKDSSGKVVNTQQVAKANDGDGEIASSQTPIAVAKLFARHFKVSEQEAFLNSHACPLAVGTPQRLKDLLSVEALLVDDLRAIILDTSWVDQKKRTLLDGPETREALFSLLSTRGIQQRLRATGRARARLVFF